MNINRIQGMNAYTANTQMADTASVQNENKQATATELNQDNTQPPQQAFKVEITQEAMTLQTQSQKNPAEIYQDQLSEDQAQQTQVTFQTQQADPSQYRQQVAQIDIMA